MRIKVLQFICPTGYYGAERWITALLHSQDRNQVESHLCITAEQHASTEIIEHSREDCDYIHTLKMTSKFDPRVVSGLVKIIREHKIEIIHTHGYKSDIIGVIAAKITGIKSVCTPHGFENSTDLKLRTYMWLGGKSFRHFDIVCPLSPQIEIDLKSIYSLDESKIRLINNGVNLDEIHESLARITHQKDPETFTIGYIGQLISRKNLPPLMEAFAKLNRIHPKSKLVILGDGEERENLASKAKSLDVTDSIEFLGFRSDRLAFLPSFDTFTLTSSLEGIPRCLMEAMGANVCVTAFDIPGVDQLVVSEETGLSVPFNDIDGLVNIWLTLINDPEKKALLAHNGRVLIEQKFSSQAMANSYLKLYRELISEKVERYA